MLGAEALEARQLLAAASISPAPAFTVQEQAAITNQVMATINDPAATTADYTATINWGDGAINAGTVVATGQSGVFQVLGSHSYLDAGTETVRVFVSKDGGTPSTVLETANVTDAPLGPASGVYTLYAVVGQALDNEPVALFTDPAPQFTLPLTNPPTPRPGEYAATIAWGDGSVSAGTISYQPSLSQFLVAGNHVYSNFGTETVSVTISHGTVPKVTVTDTAIVTDPPVVAQGGFNFTGTEGATAAAQTVATFTDQYPISPQSSYSATIFWGDQSSSAGSIVPAGNQQYNVRASHRYAEEGSGAINVVIVKDNNSTVTAVSSYNIADPAVVPTANTLTTSEGSLLSGTVATFIDPGGPEDPGDYSAQINWGDGASSAGTIATSAANNVFSVLGSHVYLAAGAEQATITIQHDSAPNATVVSNVTVKDIPLVGTAGQVFTATEGSLSTNEVVATFTDPGVVLPITTPGAYSASINWGDGGAASAGSVTFNNQTQIFTVTAQHLYVEEGTYPLAITLSHDLAPNVTVTGTAAVADPSVIAVGGFTFTGVEYRVPVAQTLATFTDPGGAESLNDYSASINWGDGTVSAGQIVVDVTGATFTVLGTHVYATFGAHTLSVTIHHDVAPDVTVTDTANIGVPPIQTTALPATWRAWTVPVELSPLARLSFTDTEMTATISWGDGGTSAGVITPDMLGSSGTVRGSHVYAKTGNYTILITVNDGPQTVTQVIPIHVMQQLLPLPNPSTATPTNYYVAQAYGDILRRPVDGGGLVYWSNALNQGVPRGVFTNALVRSPEYLGNFVINPAYQKYLGRAADPAGLQFWIGKMQSGLTDAMLDASFASSLEFYNNAGANPRGYVDALYLKVLGRPADPAGENYWVNQLLSGQSSYLVALQFANSGENFADTVNSDYETLLERAPSAIELNSAVNGLVQGTLTPEALLANIAATDEYFALAQST